MDPLMFLLIALFILLVAVITTGITFKFCTHNKITKTTKIIYPKGGTVSATEASQQFRAVPVNNNVEPSKAELVVSSKEGTWETCDSERHPKIPMPGYIPVEITSNEDGADFLTKAPSKDCESRRISQASSNPAISLPVQERRLSTTQMSELKLMDVGALPRDVASELEEQERLKKDKQKWCL